MRTCTDGRILQGLVVALSVAVWSVSAADYTWTGMTGASWNTTDANWSGAGTVWTNDAANNATFGAEGPRAVTAGPVTLNNLAFTADGYAIGGGPLLMHGGASVDASMTATLTAPVTNVGVWAKTGGGKVVLNPQGAVSNVFYSFKTAGGTLEVAGGTNLVTEAGSSPENGPAFWVSGGTLVVGGGLLKTTAGPYARVSEYGTLLVTNGICDLSSNGELLNAFNSPGFTTVGGNGMLILDRMRIVKNQVGASFSGVNINTGGTIRLNEFWFETGQSTARKATMNLNGGTIRARDTAKTRDMLGTYHPDWTNIFVNVLSGGAVFDTPNCNITVIAKLRGSPDDGGLTKLGSGTLYLRGTNTFNGATVLKGGRLNVVADHNLGAIPSSPSTNLVFLADATLQSSESHTLAASRTIWVTNAVTATFDPQTNTQTICGTIVCADTNATLYKTGSGTVILDPGPTAVNSFGTLHTAAGTLVVASGTNLVTRFCGVQNGPGLRVSGGTLLVAGGLLKTTSKLYVNVDGGHLLVTNGVVDTTSCDEILNGIASTYGFTTVSGSGTLIANGVRISQNTGNPSNTVVSVNTGGVMRLNNFYIDINFPNQKGMLFLNGGTVEARVNTDNFLGTTEKLVGNKNDKWLTNIFVHVREGGAIFDTAGKNISIKQPLYTGAPEDGGFIKRGDGMLTLLNTNTYNGVTVVEGGTLRWGRDDVLPTANTVMAGSNGVFDVSGKTQTLAGLGGGGTVENLAALTVTDTLAPGDAGGFGTLTLAGNAASIAGCTLSVNVSPEGESDALHVAGDLDLSTLTLHVENPEQLSRFKKYTIASCTGTFTAPFGSTETLPARWIVTYDAAGKKARLAYNFGTVILLR